jgi:phosphatidylinositol alpha-1,6-mannosyltransferase
LTADGRPVLLVVTPDFPPARGGIQVLSHELASNFEQFAVHLITVDTGGGAEFDGALPYPVHRVRQSHSRPLALAKLNAAAVALAGRLRPSVTLCLHTVVSPAAATLRRLGGIPSVQYVYAKELGARPRLASFALRHADRVIAISGYARDLAIAAGARPNEIELIPPGVALPGRVDRRPADRPTLLTIARLEDRYKGHDVILRALPLVRARVPDVLWAIVGDGPLRAPLEDMARALGVSDSVRFLGSLTDGERDAWLASSHVFAMVSRLPALGLAGEGFGIVYLEANAHGVPSIAGNVAGAVDAVIDGETGLLVDPTDPLAVAEAIVRLLSDQQYASELGRQGMARAQQFSWRQIAKRVEAVLHEVAAS